MTLRTGPVGTQGPSKTTDAPQSRWRQPPPKPLIIAAASSVSALALSVSFAQGPDLFTPNEDGAKSSSPSASPTPGAPAQPRPPRNNTDAQLVPFEPVPKPIPSQPRETTPSAPGAGIPAEPPRAPSPEGQVPPKGEMPHGDMPANLRTQQVKSGDTLSKVARELCTPLEDIAQLNHLTRESKLREGDWLAVPVPPKHAPAVDELLATVANGATDDVAGMLTFELPGYEVTRDPSEPFVWQARSGELRIRVLIRDACVSFTDTRTGSGGSAMVQGPSANQGTGPEDLSAAIRRAHQAFNAMQSAAARP